MIKTPITRFEDDAAIVMTDTCHPIIFNKDFTNSHSDNMNYQCKKCVEFVQINKNGCCPICGLVLDKGLKEARESLKKLDKIFELDPQRSDEIF